MTLRPAATPLDGDLGRRIPPPDGGRAFLRLYSTALNQRVAGTCAALFHPVDRQQVTRIEALLPALTDTGWTTPELAHAHFVGLADERRRHATAQRAVAQLEQIVAGPPPPLDPSTSGDNPPPWVEYALAGFVDDQRRNDGLAVELEAVTPAAATLEAVGNALTHLAGTWPEMSRVTETLVREIRWTTGSAHGSASATLTQTYGAVFIRADLARPVVLYELLVHEATHLELIARMALDKLLTNGSLRAPSPFRSVARPLTRVLHATLVAARLAEAMRRYHPATAQERDLLRQRASRFAEDLAVGLATLAEHGRWTTIGHEFFTDLRAAL
ncbi:HEXXH motif-containing putative peptide modification protein [Nocardia sp. NPDC024068]|uniref:aKG-HExxH-type peptide beta-hydroxylase n=1 Tax=Nocardia sp. NPDC024068 TaxID=3157197 RepID=UPI0033CD3DFD